MPQCAAKCWVPGCSSEVPDELVRVSHRIKTCLEHRLSKSVSFGGVQKRFCQQCTRFHELGRFDGDNHSCRSRLEKLYARRYGEYNETCALKYFYTNETILP